MKVLFFGGLACGGAEHQMVIVAKQLAERGFDVLFVTQDGNGFLEMIWTVRKLESLKYPKRSFLKSLN